MKKEKLKPFISSEQEVALKKDKIALILKGVYEMCNSPFSIMKHFMVHGLTWPL